MYLPCCRGGCCYRCVKDERMGDCLCTRHLHPPHIRIVMTFPVTIGETAASGVVGLAAFLLLILPCIWVGGKLVNLRVERAHRRLWSTFTPTDDAADREREHSNVLCPTNDSFSRLSLSFSYFPKHLSLLDYIDCFNGHLCLSYCRRCGYCCATPPHIPSSCQSGSVLGARCQDLRIWFMEDSTFLSLIECL